MDDLLPVGLAALLPLWLALSVAMLIGLAVILAAFFLVATVGERYRTRHAGGRHRSVRPTQSAHQRDAGPDCDR